MSDAEHPYARPAYAAALARDGLVALAVEPWGTPVLRRPIAGGGADAIGPYPMTVFAACADLEAGFAMLDGAGLISVALVADPLTPAPPLARFDIVRPFKTHHLVSPRAYAPNKHHRAELRRSLARCTVEEVRLADKLVAWTQLYGGLIQRHGITGLSAFSDAYFRYLATLPELVTLAARMDGEIVAMGLWFAHGQVAYNHLGASAEAGYAVGASYALYDAAIAHFAHCEVINLGGGAGANDDPNDGLARFKRGFANDAVTAHLYGKVLDVARYAALSGGVTSDYFPAYRDPTAERQSRLTASATRAISAAS